MTCTYEDCDSKVYARALCRKHYDFVRRRTDDPLPPRERMINAGKECSVDGCPKPAIAKGLCVNHHALKRRWGTPDESVRPEWRTPLIERLWRRTRELPHPTMSDCWVYESRDATTRKGYQQIKYRGRNLTTHRAAYVSLVDPNLPNDWDVHHQCGTTGCWRPDHLIGLPKLQHRHEHMYLRH